MLLRRAHGAPGPGRGRVGGGGRGVLSPATPGAPAQEGLFTAGDAPRLLGSRCAACGRHHFPRHDTCPYCAAQGCEPVELSPRGRLWAWTAVTTAPPGYRGEVPYGFGVVELPEGIRVVTRLTEPDPSRLTSGQPMAMVLTPVYDGDDGGPVLSYAFAPEGAP